MNYKNRIQKFIKGELWKISNSKSSINDYWGGYKQALIDIECIIMDIDNENELIGKHGFFWDNDNTCTYIYGKLIEIYISIDNNKIYKVQVGIKGQQANYFNFSINPPQHLK